METTWSEDMVIAWKQVATGWATAVLLTVAVWVLFPMTAWWGLVMLVVPPFIGGMIAGRGTPNGEDGAAHGMVLSVLVSTATLLFLVGTGEWAAVFSSETVWSPLVETLILAVGLFLLQLLPGSLGGRIAGSTGGTVESEVSEPAVEGR